MPVQASSLDKLAKLTPEKPRRKPRIPASPSAQFLSIYEDSKDQVEKDEPSKDMLEFENRVDGLYVCLISLHGLVRGDRMELGKDPDTGGQVSKTQKVQLLPHQLKYTREEIAHAVI